MKNSTKYSNTVCEVLDRVCWSADKSLAIEKKRIIIQSLSIPDRDPCYARRATRGGEKRVFFVDEAVRASIANRKIPSYDYLPRSV